jgi:hypothetical protein
VRYNFSEFIDAFNPNVTLQPENNNINLNELENKIHSKSQESPIESSNFIKENFRQCPYCLNFVENPSGSKFIICYSFICKGHRYFCWNCGHKLYINDKEKHFDLYGFYSDYCVNKDPPN